MKIEEAIDLFRNYLKNITDFNADEFDLAMPYFAIRELKKGEHFVEGNKTCTHFAFKVSGLVRAYYNADGEEATVCLYGTNTFATSTVSFITQTPSKQKEEPIKSCCNSSTPQPLAVDNFDCCNVKMKSVSKNRNNCCTATLEVKPSLMEKFKVKEIITSIIDLGIKKVLSLFILFVAIAYLLKTYVPDAWVMMLFSGDHFYSVPLASLIGLPLYISDATVVPQLSVLRDGGASDGTLLAFMISGPATSLGVIGGLNIIMKRRAIFLYIFFILTGSIVLGYGYDAILGILR